MLFGFHWGNTGNELSYKSAEKIKIINKNTFFLNNPEVAGN